MYVCLSVNDTVNSYKVTETKCVVVTKRQIIAFLIAIFRHGACERVPLFVYSMYAEYV